MKPKLDSLQIDLTDPAQIRRRVPDIEEIVATKQAEAREAKQDFEAWTSLLGKLKFLAGLVVRIEMPRPPKYISSPEAIDAVVNIVDREERPILALGVEQALRDDGHDVESQDAVETALINAVKDRRIQRIDSNSFAPVSMNLDEWLEMPAMRSVPEAHFGLSGPAPKTKAEAVVRVMADAPNRPWTASDVAEVMVAQGWMEDNESDLASLASTLSRLHGQDKLFRPQRGQYQLAPPNGNSDQ